MISEEKILEHFDEKPPFKEFRSTWSVETTNKFCRVVLAIHRAGLDWWHVDIGDQVRFGCKLPNENRAKAVFGSIDGRSIRSITLLYNVGNIDACKRKPLTKSFVAQLEAAFTANIEQINKWKPLRSIRPGYWPDELHPYEKHENSSSKIVSEDDGEDYFEGKESFKIHHRLDRIGKIPVIAKANRLAETGELKCEVCGFDFHRFYGEVGNGFIEAHHTIPVSMLNGKETKVSDLALVCSNCHRMLHRGKELLTIMKLKELVRKNHRG